MSRNKVLESFDKPSFMKWWISGATGQIVEDVVEYIFFLRKQNEAYRDMLRKSAEVMKEASAVIGNTEVAEDLLEKLEVK